MTRHILKPARHNLAEIEDAVGSLHMETKAIRSGYQSQAIVPESITTPISLTSIYRLKSVKEFEDIMHNEGGYMYGRHGNDTRESAECQLNHFEGGAGSLLFSSGMAAITTALLTTLSTGMRRDLGLRVSVSQVNLYYRPVYTQVHKTFLSFLPKIGVEVTFLKANNINDYLTAIKENTRVLYAESPCNPTVNVLDIQGFGRLKDKFPNIITMVDATFGSPYHVQPMKYGVDYVLHSCSKYIGGHTDLIGGSLTARTVDLWQKAKSMQINLGNQMSPFDCALVSRGLKTLALRMDRHSSNALKIAEFLETQSKVKRVYYPGLKSHPNHHLASEQMTNGFSGMICFEMHSEKAARQLVENVKVINLAVSLGGTESLIEHIASMTHGTWCITKEERQKKGVTDELIRFSVGVEHVDDLINDLKQALEKTD